MPVRSLVLLAVLGSAGTVTTPAWAEPSVEDVKAAGEQFNLGRTAFKEEEYAVAAEHFERADGLAPNPKVLQLAIEARMQAEQVGRAAQLAEVAKRRYPGDSRFADVDAIVKRAEKDFARVDVTCSEPCNLVDGIRLVHGEASREWVLFLEGGVHSIRAGFGDRDETKEYTARPGEAGTLEFSSESSAPATAAVAAGAGSEPAGALPDDTVGVEPIADDGPPASDEPAKKGLSPTWFWVGAGTTVALAGVSTWSAIDTVSNPGQDVVRAGCRGQGEDCALYQQGVQRQARTNVLWGVTGAAAAATVVLFVLTDWGGGATEEGDYGSQLAFTPWLPLGGEAAGGEAFGASARGSF